MYNLGDVKYVYCYSKWLNYLYLRVNVRLLNCIDDILMITYSTEYVVQDKGLYAICGGKEVRS